ncbi:zinc-ribbon domain-containing protein [uncultured Methanobrevibacter sp.]
MHENKNKWTKCVNCGKKVNRVAKSCPYCGYQL